MSSKIKIITAIYIFFVLTIIFIANTKSTRYLLQFSGSIPYFDKFAHFLLMGFLSFLVNLLLKLRTIKIWKLKYLLGTLVVLVIVTLEEFSQIFVAGRAFDWGDLVADFLGILLFGELARYFFRKDGINVQQ